MKRITCIVLILAILLVAVPMLQAQAQSGENHAWPFIYYYSYWTGSWIVERADGSDGFALGKGLNCGMIMDADWSPSGGWLLWHCNNREYGWTNRWIAVSADNSQRVTALDFFSDLHDDYASAQWSPAGDLILVNTIHRPPVSGQKPEWGPGVYVIDADQDKMVLEVTFDTLVDRAEWSPDGRFVLAYTSEPFDEETERITVLPVNGDPTFIHKNVTRQSQTRYFAPLLVWTPDNRLVTQLRDTGQLVFENLATGEREEFPFTTTPLDRVWYSPDNRYGLIYAGAELWLYTVSTDTLAQLVDHAVVLPSAYDPVMEEQPSFQLPAWSPDSSRALFATQDGLLYWLYTDGQVTALDLPPADEVPAQIPRVQWGGGMAFILWNNAVYIYDPLADSVLSTFTRPDTSSYYRDEPPVQDVQVSPDGRYLAHPKGNMIFGYYIWDWSHDVDSYLTPNPAIADSERMTYGEAHWSSDQDLLFVSEGVDLAGPGLSRWSVASADGQLRRTLSSTYDGGAPQALPTQVDISFIPPSTNPIVPGPSLQIASFGIWPGILSWSPDGRYLASAPSTKPWSYSGACTGGDPALLYNATTGETVAEFPFASCGCGYAPPITPDDRFKDVYLSYHYDSADLQAVQVEPYGGYPLGFAWPQTDHNAVLAIVTYECFNKYKLVLWDFSTDTIVAEYPGVSAVAFTRDGTHAALGYDDGSVWLTGYPDITQQTALVTLPTRIDRLAFSADGARLVVASVNDTRQGNDGELSVWDTGTGTSLFRTTPNPVSDSLDITPDGSALVIAAKQPYQCVDPMSKPPTMLDATTGEALNEPNTSLTAAAISPDGRYLVGTGCGVVVWDTQTLEVVTDFLGNGINVVWSPDGTKLATATRFGIYVWDMP